MGNAPRPRKAGISIHAPREGGDYQISALHGVSVISIHAPREGGDRIRIYRCGNINFISIHAPREGGDSSNQLLRAGCVHFNPRPPRGGRLRGGVLLVDTTYISIHAPREGGDCYMDANTIIQLVDFNPRPPRGGRHDRNNITCINSAFQSTPPARGATQDIPLVPLIDDNFNPRPPRGGRRKPVVPPSVRWKFQSTPPARGATAHQDQSVEQACISIHAPREGGDCRSVI